MNSMIIQSKMSKNSGHKFDCRPQKRSPSRYWVHRKHMPQVHSTPVLCFCAQNLAIMEDPRPDCSKLKILEKFPKIKALIPSCDSKLISLLGTRK